MAFTTLASRKLGKVRLHGSIPSFELFRIGLDEQRQLFVAISAGIECRIQMPQTIANGSQERLKSEASLSTLLSGVLSNRRKCVVSSRSHT